MGTLTTKGIKITVETSYHNEYSEPAKNKFIFAYRITIKNESEHTVQLLRRHWHIFDSNGSHREVEGEGVIGQQPIMRPGDSHEYVSWCPLFTGLGRMYGSYLMQRTDNKDEFNVAIPEFQLVIPSLLN